MEPADTTCNAHVGLCNGERTADVMANISKKTQSYGVSPIRSGRQKGGDTRYMIRYRLGVRRLMTSAIARRKKCSLHRAPITQSTPLEKTEAFFEEGRPNKKKKNNKMSSDMGSVPGPKIDV